MKIDAPQLGNFQTTWNIFFFMFHLSSLSHSLHISYFKLWPLLSQPLHISALSANYDVSTLGENGSYQIEMPPGHQIAIFLT